MTASPPNSFSSDESRHTSGLPDIEDRRRALEAYEHARDVGRMERHTVDFIDERLPASGAWSRRPTSSPVQAPQMDQPTDHRFVDPAATAFKVAFGFSAGAWTFRLLALSGSLLFGFLLIFALFQALLD